MLYTRVSGSYVLEYVTFRGGDVGGWLIHMQSNHASIRSFPRSDCIGGNGRYLLGQIPRQLP